MAYTPYSQALPDTSRYTLDPVLQERLYQPVRPDPYQAGMLSTMANDYYADPFGYTNRRFGKLDKTLETDKPEVGLGGMFDTRSSSDSGSNDNMPENPIAKREADLLAKGIAPEVVAEIMRAEQEERGSRLAAGLNLFANAFVPGMTALGLSKYGVDGYSDYIRGNTGVLMGNANGYIPTHTMSGSMTAEQMMASDRAAKAERDSVAQAILAREAENRAMSEISRNYGGFRDNGTYVTSYGPVVSTSGMSPETTAGLEAAQASFGYGTNADYYGD
jgi:hypothetical protein